MPRDVMFQNWINDQKCVIFLEYTYKAVHTCLLDTSRNEYTSRSAIENGRFQLEKCQFEQLI